ncbi:hypothetical protein Pdw03_6422 [Penicillium digitatum]|uniref:Uncharacterized protein n=1 Tax=Penicillium digitatum TaxID=36651 RepID=A0A7T6XJY4_PENDI|nr:hypothetical protein Pdw03_6422 [Penicillium digitatum]
MTSQVDRCMTNRGLQEGSSAEVSPVRSPQWETTGRQSKAGDRLRPPQVINPGTRTGSCRIWPGTRSLAYGAAYSEYWD